MYLSSPPGPERFTVLVLSHCGFGSKSAQYAPPYTASARAVRIDQNRMPGLSRCSSMLPPIGTATYRCNRQPLFHQVLRVRKLLVVQVHIPLGRRDIGVPEQ